MLRRATRINPVSKGTLWGGRVRARSSELAADRQPRPRRQGRGRATGPALRPTEARPKMPPSRMPPPRCFTRRAWCCARCAARTRRSSRSASRNGRSCAGSTPKCPGPTRPTAPPLSSPPASRRWRAGEKSHWAIVPEEGPGRPDRRHQPVARRRREPTTSAASGSTRPSSGQGLMTEAADRVTDYAFGKLGWPCLWLSNAQDNHASRRIKEKQGARLVDMMIGRFVGGEATRMVWLLEREDWVGRQAA